MQIRFIITPKINLPNYQGDRLKEILNAHVNIGASSVAIGKVISIMLPNIDKGKSREIADSLISQILVNKDSEDCIYELLEDIKEG